MEVKKIKMRVAEEIKPDYDSEQYPRIQRKKEVWPESDSDGYPTEKTLKYIREWPTSIKTDFVALMEFCMEAWKYREYAFKKDGKYVFQTGGWSGNEDIISAMRDNHTFWMFTWFSSRRGGHYKFDIL